MPTERAPPKAASQPLQINNDMSGLQSPDDSLEEITSSVFNSTARPSFSHPTQVGSKKAPKTSSVFNERKSRPEHHQSSKLNFPVNPNNINPMHTSSKPMYGNNNNNAYRVLPSHLANPNLPYKMPARASQPMFSTNDPDAVPVEWTQPKTSFNHSETYPEVYMNPKDAENAIKDLLEGAMDEDEEEEDDEKATTSDQPADEGSQELHMNKMKLGPQEDGSLEGIKVKLLPHQVDGIKWMKQREIGPVKKGKIPKGGILADDMGLGKTLQSISLILSNQKPAKGEKGYKKHLDNIDRTTLVVAPLALIKQWEAEIKDKVQSKYKLRVCVHHGPQRTKSFKELAGYDIVITTYQILVSEHGHSDDREGGLKAGCFGVHWWRVILDEAHSIKNRNAKSTKACYALRAEYRWCLTGTPLQNNLDELQSLICFLRVPPYDNFQEWKHSIVQVLNSNRGHIAIRRLHAFLRCIMKRRKKEILKEEGALVPGGKAAMDKAIAEAAENGTTYEAQKPMFKTTARNVESLVVEFTPAERKYYQNLETRADESLSRMMKDGVNYANALVLLLRLRQACNHPKLVGNKMDKDKDAIGSDAQGKSATNADVDSLADMLGGLGIQTKRCEICLTDLSKEVVASGNEMCTECHGDLVWFNQQDADDKERERKEKKAKRREERARQKELRKKNKARKVVENIDTEDGDEDVPVQKNGRRRNRNRPAIVDSDDEEAEGSWLVGEDQQSSLHIGKAGGTDDENAEGGGDTILSDEEDTSSDEEDGSKLSGFVINDENISRGESIVYSDDDSELPRLGEMRDASRRKSQDKRRSAAPHEESDEESFNTASEGSSDEETDSQEDSGVSDSDHEDSLLTRHERGDHVLASAKIRQLVKILGKECYEHKFIVFSQFTSMLDLVEPFLHKHGFGFVRYDGQMRNDMREESLRSLREDKRTRILLCSLKCGSLGLNLTAATRVVIMEPFWNPFIEEQAIDRVHRLTQKVDVTVYKLTVGQTVEERILELQEKKRLLAENTIEGSQNKKFKMGLNINELMGLFRSADAADGADAGPRNVEDPNVEQDVGSLMQSMRGVTKKSRPERKESEVYGRRW
ncbi:snf2 family helicase [Zalerion maritima]|uniref:Snf2 family helicase n=1 Tax=Zalerion maritima TaxID=339359 RepID=A0AAD5RZ39_9PEZI|nr:snf2 family helicase [Zalerion maritima]